MKCISGIIAVCLLIQVYGHPRQVRDVPSEQTSTTDTLQEFFTQVKSNADNLVKQISDQFEQVKEKNPAIQETWNTVVVKVNEAFKEANSRIPEAKEQAEALQTKFQDLGNLVKQEYDKISKSISEQTGTMQESFAANFKSTVDNLVQDIQKVNTKIGEAVAKYQEPGKN